MKAMMAIIRADFWQRRWSLLWWSLGVALLVGMDTLLYRSIKGEAAQLGEALAHMPKAIGALFADNADFISQSGFLSGRVYYLLLPLLLTIFSIGLGAGLIAKEERRGTLELLLARPASRTRLLLSKWGTFIAGMTLVGIVALIIGLVCLRPAGLDAIPFSGVIRATIGAVLISSVSGMVAFTLSAMGRPVGGAAVGIASLFAFGSYLIASLESLASWLAWPAKLMPYHYFNPADILRTGIGGGKAILGFATVIAVLAIVSVISFRRRDIG
jgi:ABC-2 type transport system permease protein